ncbi:hypothetical protein [Kordiimonas sp. SCSIO 12610]|uniref:hypothetical protein n=1 Tax=Kordiimonas sp. SCSIO 12610 TaxID=2829597 RepID=UPI00210A3F7A|nr:hypothetical protein [Kordiimonas sp. SCSIO 12610]UTW54107.1 hypothetical protein KFF44_09710 [Kordiimonas sp. SCSIO 12610]
MKSSPSSGLWIQETKIFKDWIDSQNIDWHKLTYAKRGLAIARFYSEHPDQPAHYDHDSFD